MLFMFKNACVKAKFKHLEKFLKFCCPKAALPMKSRSTSDKSLPVFCLSNCLPGLLQLIPAIPYVTGFAPSFQTHTAPLWPFPKPVSPICLPGKAALHGHSAAGLELCPCWPIATA